MLRAPSLPRMAPLCSAAPPTLSRGTQRPGPTPRHHSTAPQHHTHTPAPPTYTCITYRVQGYPEPQHDEHGGGDGTGVVRVLDAVVFTEKASVKWVYGAKI